MSNANNPANPSDVTYEKDGVTVREIATGLTKREHFAGLAMQGWLARCATVPHTYELAADDMALVAVSMADALLKELDK